MQVQVAGTKMANFRIEYEIMIKLCPHIKVKFIDSSFILSKTVLLCNYEEKFVLVVIID